MSRTIVVWSGGMDSTVALHMAALNSTRTDPVFAVSVRNHHLLNKLQSAGQTKARANYLSWAKKNGLFIRHKTVSISGNVIPENEDSYYAQRPEAVLRQRHFFISLLAPYWHSGDRVVWGEHFPVIGEHSRLCRSAQRLCQDATHVFPFAHYDKDDIIRIARGLDIPRECIWSCDQPTKDGRECLRCIKCQWVRSIYKYRVRV